MTASIPNKILVKKLIDLENSYYERISLPDLIILLRADPKIAIQRKKDESEEDVRSRSTEVWEIDWQETLAIVVNANHSKEEVLLEVKELIWPRL
jgi:thymidylate kinase